MLVFCFWEQLSQESLVLFGGGRNGPPNEEHDSRCDPNPRTAEGVECRRCNDGKQAQHTVTQPPPPPANAVLVTGLLDDNLF